MCLRSEMELECDMVLLLCFLFLFCIPFSCHSARQFNPVHPHLFFYLYSHTRSYARKIIFSAAPPTSRLPPPTSHHTHTQWAASLHAHLDRVAAVLPALHVARSQFARVQHAVARAHAGMQALLEHVVQHTETGTANPHARTDDDDERS